MIYLNGIQLNVTLFPDNTSQVWQVKNIQSYHNEILWVFSNEAEFLHLAQLKDLIDKETKGGSNINLKIKYLPYGRQDKKIDNNTTFALRTFAKLLNSLYFDKVFIIDPHSKIALGLINNSSATYPIEQIKKVMELTKFDTVCYPDDGSLTKYAGVYDYPYFYGEKVRDQLTGNIISYKLYSGTNIHPIGKSILIIDDICDGGMTFKFLTEELLTIGIKEVNLFVTHGLFTKGLKVLKDAGINRIFTQDGEVSEVQNNIVYKRF